MSFYDYMIRFSDYLEQGMKMRIVFPNGASFSWHEVFMFEVVACILIEVLMGILLDD